MWALMLMLVLIVMMQRNAVEFLEGIYQLSSWRSQIRVQWDSLDSAGTDVDARAFLDIAEVHGVDCATLMRDHGWLHMA